MNWDQLRTMLWLRWRLTRNQWSRGGRVNAVITLIVVGIALGMGVAGGVAGVLGGALELGKTSPAVLMLIWDGLVMVFLFLWMIGILAELQRAELIDFSRLLHLPVSLRDVFLLNYVSSHFSLSLAVMVPGTLGLAAGLAISRGPAMLLLVPLAIGFFFMITAWTYCLRGWLASLMVNQRRRRAIIMGITVGFILVAQLPNLLTQVWAGRRQRDPNRPTREERQAQREQVIRMATLAHQPLPILWLPYGARRLAEGAALPAVWGALGAVALGALGLRRAYRTTLKFYQGGTASQAAAARPQRAAERNPGRLLVERHLPGVPAEAGALALASLRSLSRAPEVKMALALNVFIFCMVGAGLFVRGTDKMPEVIRPFIGSTAVMLTFLGMAQLLFNQFGFDRDGFRVLVLLPARRTHVLLAKNLATLPFAVVVFAVFLALIAVLARLDRWLILAAGCQFVGAFFALSALGNWVSILAPYRIAAGSLKPTKMKATTAVLVGFIQMLLPLATLPILIPAGLGLLFEAMGWASARPITVLFSAMLAGVGGLVYWWTLKPLGDCFQRREQRILERVTQEVE